MKTLMKIALAGVATMTLASMASAEDVLSKEIRDRVKGELVWHDSSGGALTRARDETTNKHFVAETGVDLKADFAADLTRFFAAMEADAPIPWSMVEFPTKGDFIRARDAGFVQKLDPTIVDVSKVEPGNYDEYGIDVIRYGIVLTYNTDKFSGDNVPTSVSDLYDLERFPGKRCLFKYPQYGGVLESALIAAGTPRESLYPLDLDKAFAKLDTIKSETIWWGAGEDAVRLLSSGECSMGIAWSGRVYSTVKDDKAPLAIVWQDSFYSNSTYGVPKGAPNPDAGMAMIAHFVSDIEGQKELVNLIAYTSPLAGMKLEDYGPAAAGWIVAGENAERAIQENAEYYAENLPAVVERFNRWVASN